METPDLPTDHAAQAELLQQEILRKSARAKKAEDWFDIFIQCVEQGVKQELEKVGAGDKVLEALEPQRSSFRRVRERLRVQGLELNENVEVEGPELGLNQLGFPMITSWPMGQKATFTWTDGSQLVFLAEDALTSVGFFMWWVQFQQVHVHEFGGIGPEEKRRIILPGTAEHDRYMRDKRENREL